MISRGGANLGDKTILDSMDAVITATKGLVDPEALYTAAAIAA